MRWLSVRILPGALLFAGVSSIALFSGCERVSYYSLTGSPEDDDDKTTSGSTSSTNDSASMTRKAVLTSIGVCAAALYEEAAKETALFRDAAIAAAEASPPDAGKTLGARDAWRAAMDKWQQAELIRIGPAAPASSPGGKDMRDIVYSWPLVSRCLVEQTLVSKGYETQGFFQTALVNMRGFDAAEYLLFYEGADNACSAASSINANGSWAALTADELTRRKLVYASKVAADTAEQTRSLADLWSIGGGGFATGVANAGASGSMFATDRLAMNIVSDGLFYLDTETKDLKLGRPLGLIDCTAATCPESVESRFAKRSRTHVKNNLLGFSRIFDGCEEGQSIGFDDLLTALGRGSLATEMKADIEEAIEAADALPSDDIAEALVLDKEKVALLHAALKKLTDAMKTEFVTVLDLELPQTVEGDND